MHDKFHLGKYMTLFLKEFLFCGKVLFLLYLVVPQILGKVFPYLTPFVLPSSYYVLGCVLESVFHNLKSPGLPEKPSKPRLENTLHQSETSG